MIRSFPLLNFFTVGSVVIFGSLTTLANAKARDISCGDIRYTIETSLFSTNVIINDVKENDVVMLKMVVPIASQMPTLRWWLSLRSRVTIFGVSKNSIFRWIACPSLNHRAC